MASRPEVTVYSSKTGEASSKAPLPSVFRAPIRTDVVRFVHDQMRCNKRQAYAVFENAGHQHSAESWGTGRAVARIPRISGGGTNRSGQGAFGNMCRKGRMFAPTKVWRKWHRRINQGQRRYATCSALAASALPALVEARGHRISNLPQVPLVIDGEIEKIKKTKTALALLKAVGAYADVEKSKVSRKVRAGKGKLRNRRHVERKGPLVIYSKNDGVARGFRNIPGVELAPVTALNLLQLAPGGHVGRFCIWSEAAFKQLDSVFGTGRKPSQQKHGFNLPHSYMVNSDIARIINSDEIQSAVRPAGPKKQRHAPARKNPLTNLNVMVRLNPYTHAFKRSEYLAQQARVASRQKNLADKRKDPSQAPAKGGKAAPAKGGKAAAAPAGKAAAAAGGKGKQQAKK